MLARHGRIVNYQKYKIMKPYFTKLKYSTKWIPVEGEIKEGDKVLSESYGHPAVSILKIMDDGSLLSHIKRMYD